jgi:protein-disulfide isomerase
MMRTLILLLAALLPAAAADPPNGKIVGSTIAPIRLEVFSDFSCPGCKAFHEQVLPVLMRDFVSQGKAFIVFRDYVLPPSPGHQFSGQAARYAVAANRVGKYMPVADALFLTQASWAMTGKVWEAVAPALSAAERTKVQALVDDPSVNDEVTRDTTAGQRAGLIRTPTVGVNFRSQHQLWNQWGGDNSLFFGYLRELLKK